MLGSFLSRHGLRNSFVSWGLTVFLLGCQQVSPVTTIQFQAFDDRIGFTLVEVSQTRIEQAVAQLGQDLSYLGQTLSPAGGGSLEQINRQFAAGTSLVAPPDVLPLIRLSQDYEQQSSGLFNPAIGTLNSLWNVHTPSSRLQAPTEEEIRRVVDTAPAMHQIRVNGIEMHSENPSVQLDFGNFGKAYAIDLAIKELEALGIRNALVQTNELWRALGDRDGHPWLIPIHQTHGQGIQAMARISHGEAMATIDEGARSFLYQGNPYHAIIDPRSGHPAMGARSVTVITEDLTHAVATATACFIAGPSDWYPVAQRMGVQSAIFVEKDGTVHMTPEMAERVELLDRDAAVVLTPSRQGQAQNEVR